jgi:hypothetical protein
MALTPCAVLPCDEDHERSRPRALALVTGRSRRACGMRGFELLPVGRSNEETVVISTRADTMAGSAIPSPPLAGSRAPGRSGAASDPRPRGSVRDLVASAVRRLCREHGGRGRRSTSVRRRQRSRVHRMRHAHDSLVPPTPFRSRHFTVRDHAVPAEQDQRRQREELAGEHPLQCGDGGVEVVRDVR